LRHARDFTERDDICTRGGPMMRNTRRIARALALGALVTPVLAGSVLAANPRYEAVAGNFTLPTAAQAWAS
jgi:hypothetical protein